MLLMLSNERVLAAESMLPDLFSSPPGDQSVEERPAECVAAGKCRTSPELVAAAPFIAAGAAAAEAFTVAAVIVLLFVMLATEAEEGEVAVVGFVADDVCFGDGEDVDELLRSCC